MFRLCGAAPLTDAGFAAAAAIEGGVQGFGQGTDIAARLGKAVAGALFVGGQGRAQAGGGFGQAASQPVQAVRVQPRHDADGIRTGRYLRGQRVKELAAQPEVGELQGGVLVIHPVHGVGRLAGLGAEQGTDLCLPRPHGLCGFQRAPAADDAQAHAALIVFGG